jgi:tetratricopeptide (TPR) repeat protein
LNSKKEQKALTLYEKGLKAVEANKAPNAIKYYREAISLKPDFYQALNNLGNLYQAKKNFEAALSSFKAALAITGDNAVILNNIGNNYRLQGNVDTALTYFRKAVFKDPTYVSAQLNLGTALFDIGETTSAIEVFELAKSKGIHSLLINLMLLQSKYVAPDSKEYLKATNDLYVQLSDVDPSNSHQIQSLLSAITVPNSNDCLAETLINFALSKGLSYLADALYEIAKVLPNCAERLQIFLARKSINSEDDLSITIQSLKKLITKYPHEESYQSLLADTFFWKGKLNEARNTLNSIPLSAKSRPYCESWFAFNDHDFNEAWKLYKVSIRASNAFEAHTSLNIKSIHKQHIRIISDQGIGDQVMFMTCLNDLVQQKLKVLELRCDPRLHETINRSYPNIVFNSEINTPDQEVSISSLPSVFRNDISSFREKSPLFSPDTQKKNYWEKKLNDIGRGLKIGFAWKGGTAKHQRLASTKSLELKNLSTLFRIPNTQWINLQYGNVAKEIQALKQNYPNIHNFEEIDPLKEVENQFALISKLDLVIQPSNASIHFAGALGVKSWVILGHPHDFRWFPNGKDEQSAWYPSVRMIKKGQKQSWEELVESLVPELTALAATKS